MDVTFWQSFLDSGRALPPLLPPTTLCGTRLSVAPSPSCLFQRRVPLCRGEAAVAMQR